METLKSTSDPYSVARRRMIDMQLVARGIRSEKVLQVMRQLPRHYFVDPGMAAQAYGDYPVAIGAGQTISQPYIVALMTEALELKGDEKVLEIGTGCGYQTAVLASLAKQIYTIERIKTLGLGARRVLKQLHFRNIVMRVGDGTNGWQEAQPFDAILAAAGSPEIPAPLVAQLGENGKLVIPVGTNEAQSLLRIRKHNGQVITENLGPCRFVKLVGRHGWQT